LLMERGVAAEEDIFILELLALTVMVTAAGRGRKPRRSDRVGRRV
jgi:hypothetical protein